MARRSPTILQADIARTGRALTAIGFKIARVWTRADGVVFELDDGKEHPVVPTHVLDDEAEIVL